MRCTGVAVTTSSPKNPRSRKMGTANHGVSPAVTGVAAR
ncbi:Uncharacterised protein [Mycobacteroides abscessus]|nr:Uncharacterised protein [Mycobacteroides abscessus]